MVDSLDRLYAAVLAAKHADPRTSRTARLMRSGRAKMAKKLAEEAVEVIIDAMHGGRDAVVRASVCSKLPKRSPRPCKSRNTLGKLSHSRVAACTNASPSHRSSGFGAKLA